QLALGKEIAPATDVWALGLLAFWMLTGKEYWVAANEETIAISALLLELVTTTAPEAASARAARLGGAGELPPGFDEWFAECVNPDPTRRPKDAAACIAALRRALDEGAAAATEIDDDATWWEAHATATLTEGPADPAREE